MPPRLARLLAAVLAIALVVGAFAVRGALSGDDDGTASGPGGDDPASDEPSDGAPYRVLCDEDLGDDVCTAVGRIDGVDEVEVVTLAQVLAADDLDDADAWLTLDPLPGVLDESRSVAQLPPLATEGAAVEVGSATLSLLSLRDAIDCTPVAWRCLAEASSTQDVGLPGLDTSAGLAIAGAAYAAIGDDVADRGIGALDDGDTEELLTDLTAGAEGTLAEQQGTIVTQRGRYAGVVTTHGWAERRVATSPASGLATADLDPGATVGVVLAGLGVRGPDAVATLREGITSQTVTDALTEAGWDGPPDASSGLPEFDVIYALREELGS